MLNRTRTRILPPRIGYLLWAALLLPASLAAQVRHQMSLQQAVEFALANNETVKNAILARESAWSRKNETRAQGLPQVSANGGINYNFIVPTTPLPAQIINPNAEPGTFVGVQFSPRTTANGLIQVSQLVFDGRYITALRASNAYLKLAEVQANRTEVEVAANVSKAYYNALVAQRRLALLQSNLVRSEALLRETRVQVENGLAETIEVNRLQVSLNGLRTDIENAAAGVDVGRLLLKFQMGMPLLDELVQTDTIALDATNVAQVADMLKDTANFQPENRIEYQELLRNRALNEYNVQQYQAGFLPRLSLDGSYGFNSFTTRPDRGLFPSIGGLTANNSFQQAAVGLNLSVPIFDGFLKRSQIEQARYANEQLDNGILQARQNFTLQFRQAQVNMRNALARIRNQQENIVLAEEVLRQSQVKYSQGIGSNLEVTVAEGDLRDAQTNYVNALLDAYLAQVDLQVAMGTLLKK